MALAIESGATFAQSLPQGGTVVGGTGTIQQNTPKQLTINQTSPNLAIDWQRFSVGAGHTVRFEQPSTSAIALNRVIGPDPSQIFGQIQANGRVVIANPNGIYFGPSSRVDVNGLVASTANIRTADFMAGKLDFGIASLNPDARIVNEGTINITQGGFAVLAAAAVKNTGTVIAQGGTVVLAGTPTFALDFHGDGLLKFAATGVVNQAPNGANALVENTGTVSANGGRVLMTARAARDVINNVINTTGIVEARSARVENGEIVIDGGENGIVSVNGLVNASGNGADARGGNVTVLGEKVGLFERARVDVSGAAGGGQALIGGNYQGKGPEANAKMVYMDARAVIDASATANGDGGRVILWSDEVTRNAGHIDVSGANNGGFVEVSSKGHLDFRGTVNLRGLAGRAGHLLLDPNDITIGGTDTNITNTANTFDAAGAGASVISLATLYGALASGAVTVQTALGSGGLGDITISEAIAYMGAASSLTLLADRDIIVGYGISSTNALNVTLNALRRVQVNANIAAAGGDILIKANVATWTTPGVTLPGFGSTPGSFDGVDIAGGVALTTTGNIWIAGKGGSTGGSGVVFGNGATATTASGSIWIYGGSQNYFGVVATQSTPANSIIATSGSVTIVGDNGSGGGAADNGILLNRAGISAAGNISVTGSGGASVGDGLSIVNGASLTSTGGGTIWMFGESANVGANGINFSGGGTISTTGVGSITISSGSNVSISGGTVTAAQGDIRITGNVNSWLDPTDINTMPDFGSSLGSRGVSLLLGTNVSTTNGGSVFIAGKGGTSTQFQGVNINNSTIQTWGSGFIIINGQGSLSAPTGAALGVSVSNGSLIQSEHAHLSITGTGGNAPSGYNSGVLFYNASISAAGNAAITIKGTGGTEVTSESLYFASSSITSSGNGTISLIAPTPVGSGLGINFVSGGPTNTVTLGGATFQGNLLLQTNSLSNILTAPTLNLSRSPGGTLTFRSDNPVTPIGVVGSGVLQIPIELLSGPIVSGFSYIEIGSPTQSGAIQIGSGVPFTLSQNLGVIAATAPITVVGTINLGGKTLELSTGGTIGQNSSSPIQGSGILILSGNDNSTNSGTVSLTEVGNNFGVLQLDRGLTGGNIEVTTSAPVLDISGTSSSSGTLMVSAPMINVGSSLSAQAFGSIQLRADTSINVGANITAAQGDILITGYVTSWTAPYETNAPVFGTLASGNFIGVNISADVTTSAGGRIAIAGKGGNIGTDNHGVATSGSPTISANGGGTVTIHGQGGPSNVHVTGGGHKGVYLAGGSIATVNGDLKVVGTGGGAGLTDNNIGIHVVDTFVGSNGNGHVTVIATGGNGGSRGYVGESSFGVYASASGSGTGTLTLTGTGGTDFNLSGDSPSWHSTGVEINGGSVIEARGTGLLTVTGTGGGAGTGTNVVGVSVLSGGLIKAQGSGGATIIGTGGNGNGAGNHGVVINNSNVESTGSGNILMTGTAGIGSAPVGISFAGSSVTVGGGTHTGNTTLRANDLVNSATTLNLSRQAGGGTLTFRPVPGSDGTTIGVAGGSGALQIPIEFLAGPIVNGFSYVQIGSPDQTGAINIGGGPPLALDRNLRIVAATAPITIMGPIDITGQTLELLTGGAISQDLGAPIIGSGTLLLSGTGGGTIQLDDIANAFDTVVLNRGSSSGNITISALDAAVLDISGTSSSGALTVSAPIIEVNSILTAPGPGSIRLTATTAIDVHANITTGGGNIVLIGNASWAGAPGGSPTPNGSSGDFVGVTIDGATINATGGEIAIAGQGGDAGGGSQFGVQLLGGAQLQSSGAIKIFGWGGLNGGNTNGGVRIFGGGTTVNGSTGNITIVGEGGGGTGQFNYGIGLDGGAVLTGFNGPIHLTGTATNGDGITIQNGSTISGGGSSPVTLVGNTSGGGAGIGDAGTGNFISAGAGKLTLTSLANGLLLPNTWVTSTQTGGLDASANSGAVNLSFSGNILAGPVSITAPLGTASVTTQGVLDFGPTILGSRLTATASGPITQIGAITAGSTVLVSTGTINLFDPGNNFGSSLSLTGTGGTLDGQVNSATGLGAIQSIVVSTSGFTIGGASIPFGAPPPPPPQTPPPTPVVTPPTPVVTPPTPVVTPPTPVVTPPTPVVTPPTTVTPTEPVIPPPVVVTTPVVPVSAPPVVVATVTTPVAVEQLVQIISSAVIAATTAATSGGAAASTTGGGTSIGAGATSNSSVAAILNPATVVATITAILNEIAAPSAATAGSAVTAGGTTPTGGSGASTSSGDGTQSVVVVSGSQPTATTTAAPPAPLGTFAIGTTITVNVSSAGVTAVTVTPPVGGGPPQVIVPGLVSLIPLSIPSLGGGVPNLPVFSPSFTGP